MPVEGEIRFSGTPQIPSGEVFQRATAGNPLWYRILEKGYEAFAALPENKGIYADPRSGGATVEQAWLVFTLFGIRPVCLLAQPLPAAATSRISRVIQSPPQELVQSLRLLQTLKGFLNVTTLHYDGQTGHCIRVVEHQRNTDRFVYHDPWPGDSLLCKSNNIAGVDAIREGTRWSVTGAEMERVIFASFVFQPDWARLEGEDWDLTYPAWIGGEFARFFHLVERQHRSEGGLERRLLSPKTFQEEVSLIIDTSAVGRIFKASLILDRRWMRRNPLLALDISKSFIACLGPRPEREHYAGLSEGLWGLRDPEFARRVAREGPERSPLHRLGLCFEGSLPSAAFGADFSCLSLRNVVQDQDHCLEIEFDLP